MSSTSFPISDRSRDVFDDVLEMQSLRPSQPYSDRHTHRLLSSSFLGLPCRILSINHKKELLRGLWVWPVEGAQISGTHDSMLERNSSNNVACLAHFYG